MDETYRSLVAIVNPVVNLPGFAIPIFEKGNRLYLQDMDERNKIQNFIEVDLKKNEIRRFNTRTRRKIGSDGIFAFYFDNSIIFGSKSEVSGELSKKLKLFYNNPFLLVEIADFLGDNILKTKAKSMALLELKRKYSDRFSELATMPMWPDDSLIRKDLQKKADVPQKQVRVVRVVQDRVGGPQIGRRQNTQTIHHTHSQRKKRGSPMPGLSEIRNANNLRADRSSITRKGGKHHRA